MTAPRTADIFRVPLLDGSWGNGQVVDPEPRAGAPWCLLTARRGPRDAPASPIALSEALALLHVDAAALRCGDWPVVGFEALPHPRAAIAPPGLTPDDPPLHDPAVIEAFLNACHGLYPWDGFPAPRFFDGLLRPGTPRPDAARTRSGGRP